jgi:peptidoglycan/LPS O-acetylase OafA/YrhL
MRGIPLEVEGREAVDSTWALGHRPSLDALRGIAVLMVLTGHTLLPEGLGGAGVALFFVLSGYLITALLIGEYRAIGRIRLRAFYLRRVRRLLPALFLLLLVLGLRAALFGDFLAWLPDAVAVASYTGNWVWAAGASLPGLGHTWSLAIEEQFYALWPLALIVLLPLGLRRLGVATGLLIALSVLLAALTLDNYRLAAVGSHSRANELLIGCLVAIACANRGADVRVPTWLAAGAAVVFVAVFLIDFWQVAILVAWIPAGLIVAWFAARPEALAWWPLTATGRISYGLYLFHFPLAFGPLNYLDGLATVPRGIAIIVVSYALACASWFLLERRFLSRRSSKCRGTGSCLDRGIGAAPTAIGRTRCPRGDRAESVPDRLETEANRPKHDADDHRAREIERPAQGDDRRDHG